MMAEETFGPYSPIKKAGNYYYVSGQVGVEQGSKTASSDIAGQTHQAMKNLAAVLAGQDLSLDDIVKTTVYLVNIADFTAVNEIYGSYFAGNKPRPARACVEVSGLPALADKPLLIEIEATAYRGTQ